MWIKSFIASGLCVPKLVSDSGPAIKIKKKIKKKKKKETLTIHVFGRMLIHTFCLESMDIRNIIRGDIIGLMMFMIWFHMM